MTRAAKIEVFFCDASSALAIKLKQVVKVGSRQINLLNRYFLRKTVL